VPAVSPPHHRVLVIPFLRGPAQRWILPNWLAITIGPYILAWRALDAFELAHELAHVKQWRRHGLLYPLLYWRASQAAQARGLDRYHDNEFEVEARVAEAAARGVEPA
jgi:hypothetical protein